MSFRSVVVVRTANVLVSRVLWFWSFVGDLGERHTVESVLEDRLDVAVRAGARDEGAKRKTNRVLGGVIVASLALQIATGERQVAKLCQRFARTPIVAA